MFLMVDILKHYLKWAVGNETWKSEKKNIYGHSLQPPEILASEIVSWYQSMLTEVTSDHEGKLGDSSERDSFTILFGESDYCRRWAVSHPSVGLLTVT